MKNGTVLTVTLNPCLDRSITVKEFYPGQTNRILSVRTDVGGKGINVSRLLQDAGIPTHALAVTAGSAGKVISDTLDSLHIPHSFFAGQGETRTNLKILDAATGVMTECNEPGIPCADAVENLMASLAGMLPEASMLVLSGSVPPDVPANIYYSLAQIANQAGVPVVLDASGAFFEEGVKASPFAVKPNREEFETWAGKKMVTLREIAENMHLFRQHGVAFVTVSLGADGALFLAEDRLLRTYPLPVTAVCPAAAGDAMVAMLCYARIKRLPLEETVRLMTAAGSLTAALPGTQMASFSQILQNAPNVQTEHLYQK